MRVLCSTTAGDGHFGPLTAIARACVAAGHEVVVAAPESFAGAVGRAGLTHAPFPDVSPEVIGPVFGRLPALPFDEANATVVREVFARLNAQAALASVQDLVARWRPDIVVREPAEFASLAAAVAANVPHAQVAIGVAALGDWMLNVAAAALDELGERVGLGPGAIARADATGPVLSMVPESLDRAVGGGAADRRTTVRFRTSTAAVQTRLPPVWGNPEHPLVYVTFGTVAAGLGAMDDVFGAALHSLADLPVRVLLTTGHAANFTISDPPANARVEKFWPQAELMPATAVVVGHGGFGTTLTALAGGVPQVVLPLFTTDQEYNADGVAELGVGVRLDRGPDGVAGLAQAVRRVLADPGFGERARIVADDISRLPDPSEVVGHLETWAGRSR